MSIEFERFIEATCNILDEDGFESYLPTLYSGDNILLVEGIPDSTPHTEALNNVGPEHGLGTPGTFFAVLTEPDVVVAGARSPDSWRFVQIRRDKSGLVVSSIDRPLWFRL